MRLITARRQNALLFHSRVEGGVKFIDAERRPYLSGSASGAGRILGAHRHMVMRRQLRNVQGMRGLAAPFAQHDAVAYVNRAAALQVGQAEGGSAVAAVRGT